MNLQHYLGVVRRRHLHFLIPLFLGWVMVWGASWVLPRAIESTTLILVEQPTMPKDYVTPNVNDDLQDRLQSITQQILSRTRLLHIIDEFNLYAGRAAQRSPDQKVELMRKDIVIDLVRDERNRITAFNVSYSSRNPLRCPAGDQRTDQPVHQRESRSAPAAVGRHHQFLEASWKPPARLCPTRNKRSASSRASM